MVDATGPQGEDNRGPASLVPSLAIPATAIHFFGLLLQDPTEGRGATALRWSVTIAFIAAPAIIRTLYRLKEVGEGEGAVFTRGWGK